MQNIYDLSLAELTRQFDELGQPAYRARQVWRSLYVRLAASFDEMSDLPQGLRHSLSRSFVLGGLTPLTDLRSEDGSTRKFLFTLDGGNQLETVLMTYRQRRTACISTQAGCAMGCVFCATGQMGFDRNLTSGEIVAQVLRCARELRATGERLTNVVVMGMGEPFHNYDATVAAIDRLNDSDGFNFGARRFTVSTVGLIPAIERFTSERRQVNLAVSLHAATEDLRSELVPLNKRYPLRDLIPACQRYVETTGRRISFEWALIDGVNDASEQARALAGLIGGLQCHVNVIPLNPTHDYGGAAATRERARAFRQVLDDVGIPCTIRVRRGIDISAGCGQLRAGALSRPGPGGGYPNDWEREG